MEQTLQGVYLVFSDIQGNYEYLNRFLKATKDIKRDGSLCLGDIVQNMDNFSDNRCIDAVRKNATYCVRGNHDTAPSPIGQQKITYENQQYISGLSQVEDLGKAVLFHSSIRHRGLRLHDSEQFLMEAEFIKSAYPRASLALFGHTHKRGVHVHRKGQIKQIAGDKVELRPKELSFINPGGIGLSYGAEKTFAVLDIPLHKVTFFTLEKAEEMAYMCSLVNSFDNRYMPVLNIDSYEWFIQYVINDTQFFRQSQEFAQHNKAVQRVFQRLRSFDKNMMAQTGTDKKKKYLDEYSLSLAGDIDSLRDGVKQFYQTKDPFTARREYLGLDRIKY